MELSQFEPVPGTRYVRAALREPAKRGLLGGYGEYAEANNFLFYNLDSGTARWLLAGHPSRVVEAFPLAWPPRTPDPNPASRSGAEIRAFVYTVRVRDTNGDGDVDRDDQAAVAVSAADGSGYRVLVPSTMRFLGAFWIDERRARIMYSREGMVHGAEIDMASRKVIREVSVSGIPPAQP